MSKQTPSFRFKVGSSQTFYMEGNMFDFSTGNGLYLSSNNFNGTQGYYDFYSKVKSVSAQNPPFSAYPIDQYTVFTNNTLSFKLSSFNTPQKLDIIYANDAGYRLASSGKRFSYIEIYS